MRTGRPPKQTICSVRGCGRKHHASSYCRSHYKKWIRTGSAGQPFTLVRHPVGVPCRIKGCNRLSHTQGYCNAHYLRLRIHGDPGEAIIRPRAGRGKGSRWINNHGYVVLILPGTCRRIMEHRYVMEQYTGRMLRSDETVHHKNGVRTDNRIKNLELWVRSQPSGQRVSDVVVWAREILARYG